MRDEHLNGQLFDSLLEIQVLNEAWRIDYGCKSSGSRKGSPFGDELAICPFGMDGDLLFSEALVS